MQVQKQGHRLRAVDRLRDMGDPAARLFVMLEAAVVPILEEGLLLFRNRLCPRIRRFVRL
jgi:hypothetical protein